MSTVAGWRIQIMPQYAEHDLSDWIFMNVELPDVAHAIAYARNRPGSVAGERVYAVRPLRLDELRTPRSSGL